MVRLEALLNYSGSDAVVGWRTYRQNSDENKKKTISFSSGFAELDSCIEGFESGEVVTISGNTGQGKTLFVKSLVRSLVGMDVPTTVFSFEVPTYQFLSSYIGLPKCETLYVPKELRTANLRWLAERVYEAKVKYDNKVVVIDHLHYIVDMGQNKNFSLDVGQALRTIKEKIAIGLNQVVFLICHQQSIGDDKEPSISSIRDSSFIGQESDTVFIVHRLPDKTHEVVQTGITRREKKKIDPSQYTYDLGQAMVKIDKARRTGVYRKKLHFQKKGPWLEPI